jgi:hypothetical protein
LPDGIVMVMKLENRIKVSHNVILSLLIWISSTKVLMYMRWNMMQNGLLYTIDWFSPPYLPKSPRTL